MKYIVMFNCARAIEKMPKKNFNRERQLLCDFIRAIHGKQYFCENHEELMSRLEFIAGRGDQNIAWYGKGNYVYLNSDTYGERVLPAAMYGQVQRCIDFENRLKHMDYDRAAIFIKFTDFYDAQQRRLFDGCYVEIIPIGEMKSHYENEITVKHRVEYLKKYPAKQKYGGTDTHLLAGEDTLQAVTAGKAEVDAAKSENVMQPVS